MKKKNGFTLVELLAVIVILAVILVIAVPKITATIESSRGSSIETSAKMILSSAEQRFAAKLILDDTYNPGTMDCTDVADINTNDYDISTCKVTFTSNVASISLTGKGKFKDYVCTGTKDTLNCSKNNNQYIELTLEFWSEFDDEQLADFGIENRKMKIKVPKKYENLSLVEIATSKDIDDIPSNLNEDFGMTFYEFDIVGDSTNKFKFSYYEEDDDPTDRGMIYMIGDFELDDVVEGVKDWTELRALDDRETPFIKVFETPIKDLGKLYITYFR